MATQGSPFPPGMQPTPQQVAAMRQQFEAEAAKQGLTPQQYLEKLKAHAMQQQQAQGQNAGEQPTPQQMQQMQQMQQQQRVPVTPGPPKPEALAVAKFLKSQDLKSRTCMFQESRKELFKVKRAIRALQSPAYAKAQQKKNSLLPPVTDRLSAENTLKLLPISMLALRVSQVKEGDEEKFPHGHPQHVHKTKAVKGLWTVRVEPQQDFDDQYHYIWLYEGSQWKQKLYAALALLAVIAVVMYPLWPLFLRIGVWYVSMGALGLLGAFFGLAIVRLIVFLITVLLGPQPGIWIYPNLFEDVGFFDSFRPMWAWRETKESLKAKKAEKKEKKLNKKKKKQANGATGKASPAKAPAAVLPAKPAEAVFAGTSTTSGADAADGKVERRSLHARVEEVEDD